MRLFDSAPSLAVLLCCLGSAACGSESASGDDAPAGSGSGATGNGASAAAGGFGGAPTTGGAAGQATGGDGAGGAGAGATTTPIFRMDCEDAPLDCGFGDIPPPSEFVTLTHVEDGGPQGEDVVEVVHTPQPPGTPQVQYNHGWWASPEPAPAQGATRYVRLWFKPLTPIDWSGTGDVWTNKFIMLGDGGPDAMRVICNLRDTFPVGGAEGMLINCARNIDGAPSQAGGGLLTPNEWHFVQIEIRSSSTSTAEDAQIAMWLDQADYASPTSQSSGGFVLETGGWTNLRLGAYANTALASTGSVRYQVGGLEFDDEFDPAWSP